jgi:hypothetical protein
MASKETLHQWLATNQIPLILNELLSRNPVPDLVIQTSGRYHAYMKEKMAETEDATSLRVEYNKICRTLEHIINQLEDTDSRKTSAGELHNVAPIIHNHHTINNYGNIEKQVNNPSIQGNLNM